MARPILGFISLILLGAAILFQFFVILSGGVQSSPENRIYFLQADTLGMNARNPSRWTFWAICGEDNNRNDNCGKPVAGLPFDPPHRTNFDSQVGVPDTFIGAKRFYYLSRFAWVFFLIALLSSVTSFLFSGLALCTRIGAYFSSFTTSIALFFQTIAAIMMTVWTVQGRNAFQKYGHQAHLGKYAYGFVWGAVVLLFLSTVSFCAAGGKRKEHRESYAATATPRRRGFFRRRRSVRKEYV